MHVFQLGGDLLQCAIRCRSLYAGDQPDQPVVAPLWRRATQQGPLDEPFGSQAPYRPP